MGSRQTCKELKRRFAKAWRCENKTLKSDLVYEEQNPKNQNEEETRTCWRINTLSMEDEGVKE